jgi:glycosyltransferase involved in cell wall biosynthesis
VPTLQEPKTGDLLEEMVAPRHPAPSRDEELQRAILGSVLPRPAESRLSILGLTAWREFWSMGDGAGAAAFVRSPLALVAAGHHLDLIQPCGRGDAGRAGLAGVELHRYVSPHAFSNPRRVLPWRLSSRWWRFVYHQRHAAAEALRVAQSLPQPPDLVVSFGIMSLPAARRVADTLGRPLVARCFGNNLSMALHRRRRWYGNFIERTGFRVPVDAMILTNDGSPILEALQRLGVDLGRVHFLRNGIDGDLFSPGERSRELLERLDLRPDAFVLLTATRLHSEKRIDRVLRALAELRPRVPSAVAVILGEGPERPALESLARELGIADAVRFPGAVRNRDLPPWYRLADLLLSLLDRTNASNPVQEAMACGCCVVARDVGSTAEVVRHGETGILISPADGHRLAGLLAELASAPERRAALGRRARAAIMQLCGSVGERMQQEVELITAPAISRQASPSAQAVAELAAGCAVDSSRPPS